MKTNEEPFLGKIITDIASIVLRDVLHELRPDVVFADEFKDFGLEFANIEPRVIAREFIDNAIKRN